MFKSWHLAEVFVSLQGEGVWQGTQMLFLRTVGCNVGVKKNAEQVNAICTSWDGREFTCDTDYRKHLTLTEDQLDKLIQEFPGTHVCVTGGEPLLHKELLSYIAGSCKISVKMLHIETSGTLPIVFEGYHAADPDIWITVSPKKDCLSDSYLIASEIKILVDDFFQWSSLPAEVVSHPLVFLQPIAKLGEKYPVENAKKCIQIINEHPNCRLSLQLQKILEIL